MHADSIEMFLMLFIFTLIYFSLMYAFNSLRLILTFLITVITYFGVDTTPYNCTQKFLLNTSVFFMISMN